jgi:hypothetical protein
MLGAWLMKQMVEVSSSWCDSCLPSLSGTILRFRVTPLISYRDTFGPRLDLIWHRLCHLRQYVMDGIPYPNFYTKVVHSRTNAITSTIYWIAELMVLSPCVHVKCTSLIIILHKIQYENHGYGCLKFFTANKRTKTTLHILILHRQFPNHCIRY